MREQNQIPTVCPQVRVGFFKADGRCDHFSYIDWTGELDGDPRMGFAKSLRDYFSRPDALSCSDMYAVCFSPAGADKRPIVLFPGEWWDLVPTEKEPDIPWRPEDPANVGDDTLEKLPEEELRTYKLKDGPVAAIRLSPTSLDTVRNVVKPYVLCRLHYATEAYFALHLPKHADPRPLYLGMGDWVVRNAAGSLSVWRHQDFTKRYTPFENS